MTTTTRSPRGTREAGPLTRRIRHGWVLEVLGGVVVYFGYDWLREQATGTSADALRHAEQIVDAERFLGIYHEHSVQDAFLGADWFISFWNIFYGTVHFVLPVVALVWLYRKAPARYVLWRTTLLFMLGLALDRLRPLPAHPSPPHARALRVRRHRRRLLQLRAAGGDHLRRRRPADAGRRRPVRQPLRRHAEPPRGVVDVGGAGALADGAALVGHVPCSRSTRWR